jgi:hypothetical protein
MSSKAEMDEVQNFLELALVHNVPPLLKARVNLILESSFLADQSGRVQILLDTSGIFSSLNHPPSTLDHQPGQWPG